MNNGKVVVHVILCNISLRFFVDLQVQFLMQFLFNRKICVLMLSLGTFLHNTSDTLEILKRFTNFILPNREVCKEFLKLFSF